MKELKKLMKSEEPIETLLFPRDTPVIAQIIAEFTNALENLKKYQEQ